MRLAAAARLGLDFAALAARNPRMILACATGFRKSSSMQRFSCLRRPDPGHERGRRTERRAGRGAALFPHRGGRQSDRPRAGLDDRHGAVPSRTHRRRAGGSRADAGDHAVVPAGRASVGRGDQPAGTGARLSADADAASPAVCDEGWFHLRDLHQRRALGACVRRARPAGAGRRSAFRQHPRAIGQRGCAVCDADRRDARPRHRGVAGHPAPARYPMRAGGDAGRPVRERLPEENRFLSSAPASGRGGGDRHRHRAGVLRQPPGGAPVVADAWAAHARRCCARSAWMPPGSRTPPNDKDAPPTRGGRKELRGCSTLLEREAQRVGAVIRDQPPPDEQVDQHQIDVELELVGCTDGLHHAGQWP